MTTGWSHGVPQGEKMTTREQHRLLMGVSRFLTSKSETVFGHKRGLENVFRGNDRGYPEVFEAADPEMTTRTPRNPILGPFLAFFRFYKNPDFLIFLIDST